MRQNVIATTGVFEIARKLHKHFVLTIGRSGSNTLVDMLNQNPAVLNYGEVLGEWNTIRKIQRRIGAFRQNDTRYLDALLGNAGVQWTVNSMRSINKVKNRKISEIKRMSEVKTVGVKEFSLNLDRYGVADYLQTRKDIRVVSLVREDVLARMISNAFLEATGVVLRRDTVSAATGQRRLHLAPEVVLEKLEIVEAENKRLTQIISDLGPARCFQLEYEDLYSGEAHTRDKIRAIYDFLQVPDFVPAIRMTKLAKKDPLSGIENGKEVREIIRGTRFERFLFLS